jgi:aspartate/methionine/tyrosine aminotransferase
LLVAKVTASRLAASLGRLGTESAFSVLARARELERDGREVIHLEIGEPDFETPAHVCEAAFAAIRAGQTHYCPSAGLDELREAAAAYLSNSRGIDVRPGSVLIANGAKPFLFFTILAVCDPGDEVIYPDPGFPIYESAIAWAGAVPVPLPLHEEKDFVFDVGELEARLSPRTKLVILNSPQNPTGGVIDPTTIDETSALIRESDAWVLSDEVYWRLVYDDEFSSIASRPGMLERTILLDGLSKTYAMTGWRCGFAAVPQPLIDPLVRFFVNSTSCVPPFVQLAGVAALTGPQDSVETMLEEFRLRRRLVVERLNETPGIRCRPPAGAFYAFPNVSALPLSADEFASRLLEEAGVALLAGSAFGQIGRDHLRVSYANSQEALDQALDRITAFVDTLV